MLKAYSYLRISTTTQKVGDGIRRQLEASKRYADEHDLELVEEMSDIGLSAYTGKNVTDGALGRFIAAIDAGAIAPGSVLIVESLDRLSRENVLAAFAPFSAILGKGITIVTLLDGQTYTSESVQANVGQLFTSLGIMLRAHDESVTKSKRGKANWSKRRDGAANKRVTSMRPAWLDLSPDGKGFVARESAAETIREIFNMSISGMGIYSIVRTLNQDRTKYPTIAGTGRWYESYIAKILKSRSVIGEYQPQEKIDGKRVDVGPPIIGYYPPVVSADVFHLSNKKMIERDKSKGKGGRKGLVHSNLFTGVAFCGSCGGNMVMKSSKSKGESYKYLRCHNSLISNGCDCPSWTYTDFEGPIVDFVKEVNFSELVNGNDTVSLVQRLTGEREAARASVADLQKRFETILDLVENPSLSEKMIASYTKRASAVELEIDQQAAVIADLDGLIAQAEAQDSGRDQTDFLAMYAELKSNKDEERLREIRFAMTSIIKRSISKILVYNDFKVNPWEIMDVVSDQILEEKYNIGHTTEAKLERYFSTPRGQRTYTNSERYLVVRFKSGAVRVIHPFAGVTYLSVDERLAAMRKGGRSSSPQS